VVARLRQKYGTGPELAPATPTAGSRTANKTTTTTTTTPTSSGGGDGGSGGSRGGGGRSSGNSGSHNRHQRQRQQGTTPELVSGPLFFARIPRARMPMWHTPTCEMCATDVHVPCPSFNFSFHPFKERKLVAFYAKHQPKKLEDKAKIRAAADMCVRSCSLLPLRLGY
jgi:hypothetical protein